MRLCILFLAFATLMCSNIQLQAQNNVIKDINCKLNVDYSRGYKSLQTDWVTLAKSDNYELKVQLASVRENQSTDVKIFGQFTVMGNSIELKENVPFAKVLLGYSLGETVDTFTILPSALSVATSNKNKTYSFEIADYDDIYINKKTLKDFNTDSTFWGLKNLEVKDLQILSTNELIPVVYQNSYFFVDNAKCFTRYITIGNPVYADSIKETDDGWMSPLVNLYNTDVCHVDMAMITDKNSVELYTVFNSPGDIHHRLLDGKSTFHFYTDSSFQISFEAANVMRDEIYQNKYEPYSNLKPLKLPQLWPRILEKHPLKKIIQSLGEQNEDVTDIKDKNYFLHYAPCFDNLPSRWDARVQFDNITSALNTSQFAEDNDDPCNIDMDITDPAKGIFATRPEIIAHIGNTPIYMTLSKKTEYRHNRKPEEVYRITLIVERNDDSKSFFRAVIGKDYLTHTIKVSKVSIMNKEGFGPFFEVDTNATGIYTNLYRNYYKMELVAKVNDWAKTLYQSDAAMFLFYDGGKAPKEMPIEKPKYFTDRLHCMGYIYDKH